VTVPTATIASGASVPVATVPQAVSPGIGNAFEVLLALALVLVTIFALAWLMRRLRQPVGRGRALRAVAELPVGDKERVVLVALGTRQWLLGVTAGGISVLQQLEAAEEAPPAVTPPGFRDVLRQSLGLRP
jgi:flagellar protein FliO/FliZ